MPASGPWIRPIVRNARLRTLPDGRGQAHEVYRGPGWLGGNLRDDMSPEHAAELRRRLQRARWPVDAILILAGATLVWWLFRRVVSGPIGWDLVPAAGFVLVALAVLRQALRRLADRPPQEVAAELLRLGRCPSCAFLLTSTAPQPDGCTVCPECGAAWKL